ncbi:MAG: ComF family protein [Rhizobiaceae bacterium]
MITAAFRPTSLKPALTGFLRRLRDQIVPVNCLSCDRATNKLGQLCALCCSHMQFIEKPRCAVLGTPFSDDLGEGALSASAIANPPPFETSHSVALHDDTAWQLVHGLKFADRTDLAPWMARFMLRASESGITAYSVIIPVALHRCCSFMRRCNQFAEPDRHLSKVATAQYRPDLIIRSRATKQRVGLDAKERENNVRGALRISKRLRYPYQGSESCAYRRCLYDRYNDPCLCRGVETCRAARIDCPTFARVAPGDMQTHI